MKVIDARPYTPKPGDRVKVRLNQGGAQMATVVRVGRRVTVKLPGGSVIERRHEEVEALWE